MNAQQLLQWIQDNRPDWANSAHFAWLQWALQGPNKADVLNSVNRDIQNGETDIQKVNTNAEYNIQQANQKPTSGTLDTKGISAASIYPGEYPGQQPTHQGPPTPSSSTWTSVQQMEQFIEAERHLPGAKTFDVSGLTGYVQSLPKNQQGQALASIQQFLKDRSNWTPIQQKDLDDARGQAVRDVQASQPKPSGPQAPASGVDPSQNLSTVTPGSTTPGQDQIEQWQKLTGQDFETAYQNFIKSQYISVQQQTSTGVLTGSEQIWSAGGYQPISPTANAQGWQWAFTSHPISQPLTGIENVESQGKNLQVTRSQFLGMMMSSNTAATSKMGLIQATENAITAKYGITLTDAEKQQIYDKIAPMSLQQLQQQVLSQGGGVQGWATNAIATTGVFGTLVASLPEVSQNVAMQNAITTLQTDLGANYAQYITPDQITALSKMSQTDQTNFINNLPDPTHPGFTVGAWNTGYGQILSQWQQEFGFSSKPSDSQISSLMGMNTIQRTDYFNNSPSPVKGMNNLTYKNYDTAINNLRGDLAPSMGADFVGSFAPGGMNNPSKKQN